MPVELTSSIEIRISDCDARNRWRPSAILVEMQELAEKHAAVLNLPRTKLIANGMVWVLYRQRIVMHHYPTFCETVHVTTWPGPIEGPVFPRYYTLEKADGTRIGEAATSWILMDIRTRRPMRPSALPEPLPISAEREAPLPLPGMLRIANASPLMERSVRYSDLDVNGHMNNTRYIDWICDALDLDTLNERGLSQFQINYISEGRPGETLSLASAEENGAILFQGKRITDDRLVFEASVTFADKE